MEYWKFFGMGRIGSFGLNAEPSAHVCGVSHTCVYVLKMRRSTCCVILPPYCTSATMYWNVDHEIGPAYRWRSRKRMHAVMSPTLYSYGTHQPSAPNLRRSCTHECMKHSAKSSCRHCSVSTRSSRSWSISVVYERRMPARRPAGGSFVTLVDICSSPSGNSLLGRHVMKS